MAGLARSELDRSMLVEWLLGRIGWDPHDLRRVRRELAPVQRGSRARVDLLLQGDQETVLAIIEVKQEWLNVARDLGNFRDRIDGSDRPWGAVAALSTYALRLCDRLRPESIVVATTGDRYVFANARSLAEERRQQDRDLSRQGRWVALSEPVAVDLNNSEAAAMLRRQFQSLAERR